MSITLSALQKQRRDSAANWTAENPTLLAGEIGIESDTGYWKVGDGSTAWTSLAYISGLGAEIPVSRLADGSARQLLQTAANGTDVEWTSNVDIPGTLDVTGAATFDAAVTIQGNLTVNGTTTTIDTQNLIVEDKNVIIGQVTTPTDTTADGGGITLKGTTDKTINWIDATDAWTSSERFSVPTGTAGAPSLTFTGDPNTGIYSPGADQVALSTGGTGRLFVTSTGQVLTGTTSTTADSTLIVQGNASNSAGAGALQLNRGTISTAITSGSQLGVLRFSSSDDKQGGGIAAIADGAWSGTSYPIAFTVSTVPAGSTAALERMRLDSSGRLGLGTSTPGTLLDVVGGVGRIRMGGKAGSNTYLQLQSTDTSNSMELSIANSTNAHWQIQAVENGVSYRPLILNPAGGNVGIGTLSASVPLTIQADSNAFGTDIIGRAADNTSIIRFKTTDNATALGSIGQYGTTMNIATVGAGPIAFYTTNTERGRWDSSGSFLVGTSSPYPLDNYNIDPLVQVASTDQPRSAISVTNTGNNTYGPTLALVKRRSNVNAPALPGDSVGNITFFAETGEYSRPSASIGAVTEGNYTIPAASMVVLQDYYIASVGTTNFTLYGATSNTPGTLFTCMSFGPYSGTGTVIAVNYSGNFVSSRLVFTTTDPSQYNGIERMRITNDGVFCYRQPNIITKSGAATLAVSELKNGIVQYTGAAATLTLPTGTLTEGGFFGIYTNMTFEWSVINTGSGTCTIGAGTGHTIVGASTVTAGESGRFASRRTAANTFVSYRLS